MTATRVVTGIVTGVWRWGLVLACFGAISVQLAPGPGDHGITKAPGEDLLWKLELPDDGQRLQSAFHKLAQAKTTAGPGAKTNVSWRILGLVAIGEERLALIEADSGLERMGPGATLPTGEQLLEVNSNSIVIQREGERLAIGMYEQQ